MALNQGILLSALLALPALSFAQSNDPIKVAVDATDVTRKLIHAKLSFPVEPFDFARQYPEWIPAEHSPTGPITHHGGEKYPHLQRVNDKPDLLGRIIAPRVQP